MLKDILFAGFGGQGIQFCAKVVANAGMIAGKEISWLPSYGPEMRGGTSNSAVCIDDSPIASPLVNEPMYLMALNEPSFDKFIDKVKRNGVVIYDNSLISDKNTRTDISVYGIPATKLARENGLAGLANIIALGYMLKKADILPVEDIKNGIVKMSKGKQALIDKNFAALELGYNY